jgi:hypothetical protein
MQVVGGDGRGGAIRTHDLLNPIHLKAFATFYYSAVCNCRQKACKTVRLPAAACGGTTTVY